MTTYYVSSEIGSDNSAGTSATSPLATLQAAANLVKPGDTVEVMNGTYTNFGNDVLTITTSGTASAPITFEAMAGQTPVIDSSGAWQGIEINASYITINGFTVVGNAANYTLAQAMAGYSPGDPTFNGNGIAVGNNDDTPHSHIIIENNTVYNEGAAGIVTQSADYIQILNNNVHDNAHWSVYGASGISIYQSVNSDTNAGVHDIVSGNIVYGNNQQVPTVGGNTITDGEGIILDTNSGFVGVIEVQNNTVYDNGSSGIESFQTNNAVITGNTVYGNDTENVQAVSNAQIFINQSSNNTVTNNTTNGQAPPPPPAAPIITSFTPNTGGVDTTSTINLAGSAEAGSTVTVSDGGAVLGTAPVNAAGAWTYIERNAANGTHTFTATDTDANGTSAASAVFSVPVNVAGSPPPPPPPPAAPIITSFTPNTGGVDTTSTINLAGSAEAGSTVTVSDGGAVLGTAPVNAAGAWTYIERNAANGTHTFTATDTDANGTSAASAAFSVPVNVAGAGSPPPPSNLVVNGGFETGDFTGWTLSGNITYPGVGSEIFITRNAQSGRDAAALGSIGSDGTISQNIQTTAGQQYTVQFWLANESGGPMNDLTAKWNGQTLLALVNAPAQGYTQYTFNVVGTAGTSVLEFDARQDPSQWDLDSISVTAVGTASQAVNDSIAPPSTNSGPVGLSQNATATNGQAGASVTSPPVGAQSNPASSPADPFGTTAALLSQYMTASNDHGASMSTPPAMVSQASPPPVTLVTPFHM
jgi:parallel beta-helix repeat protein